MEDLDWLVFFAILGIMAAITYELNTLISLKAFFGFLPEQNHTPIKVLSSTARNVQPGLSLRSSIREGHNSHYLPLWITSS